MLAKFFGELIDYKWFIAIFFILILFLPINKIDPNYIFNYTLFPISFSLSTFYVNVLSYLSLFLIILISVFFRLLLVSEKTVKRSFHLGLLLGVMYYSFWEKNLPEISEIISIIFLLLSIYYILKLEHEKNAIVLFFNSCILLSIASVFNFKFSIFYLLPFIGLFLVRIFSTRLILAGIIGLLLPHIFLFTYKFVFLNDLNYFEKIFEYIKSQSLSVDFLYNNIWINAIALILMVLLLFRTFIILPEKKIYVRKKAILLIWFLMFSSALLFINNQSITFISFIFSLFFGFLSTLALGRIFRKRYFKYTLDLVYILIVFINFYFR